MNRGVSDQEAYWTGRLAGAFDVAGTGILAFGYGFNWWLYRICAIRFRRVVRRLGLSVSDLEILDVGCGAGFYLREWERSGARSLTGADFAESAIERLTEKFPDHLFIRADIAADRNPLPRGRFDVVSAFSVLFHIVDDAKFLRALRNIHEALVPGGTLIFSDNFVHAPRPPAGDYHVSRTLETIESSLCQTGFTVVDRVPLFVLLGDPVDSENRWLQRYWRALSWVVMRSHVAGLFLGGALFPLEVLLTSIVRESPTTEIMICRRS